MEGYLLLRSGSASTSPQRRVYGVLTGRTIWEYTTAEDARSVQNLRREHDLIGYAPATGSFVFMTQMGSPWVAVPPSTGELQLWLAGLKLALQLVYPSGSRPHKASGDEDLATPLQSHPRPRRRSAYHCKRSRQSFGITQTPYYCKSCGHAYYMEFCANFTPLPQLGIQEAVRVCDDCFAVQSLVQHLKRVDGFFLVLWEEEQQQAQSRCSDFRAWWRRRRRESRSVANALDLLEQKDIDGHDFDGVVSADTLFHHDAALKEMVRLIESSADDVIDVNGALEALDSDSYTASPPTSPAGSPTVRALLRAEDLDKYPLPGVEDIIVFMRQHRLGRREQNQAPLTSVNVFRHLCNTLMRIARERIDAVDFFLPQIAHIYYLMVPADSLDAFCKVAALEECLLSFCALSAQLSLRLFWIIAGYIDDVHRSPELRGKLHWLTVLLLRIPAAVGRRPWTLRDVVRTPVLNYIQASLRFFPTRAQKELLQARIYDFPLHRQLQGFRLVLRATACDFWDVTEMPASPMTTPAVSLVARTLTGEQRPSHDGEQGSGELVGDARKDADGAAKGQRENGSHDGDANGGDAHAADGADASVGDTGDADISGASDDGRNGVTSSEEGVGAIGSAESAASAVGSAPGTDELKDAGASAGAPETPGETSAAASTPPVDPREPEAQGLPPAGMAVAHVANGIPVGTNTLEAEAGDEDADEDDADDALQYMNHESVFFMDQLRWIFSLTKLVDDLRAVAVPERKAFASYHMRAMMQRHRGYHPIGRASEDICPITRVLVDDMHVFKTKARVPTLLLYEIIRPAPTSPAEAVPVPHMSPLVENGGDKVHKHFSSGGDLSVLSSDDSDVLSRLPRSGSPSFFAKVRRPPVRHHFHRERLRRLIWQCRSASCLMVPRGNTPKGARAPQAFPDGSRPTTPDPLADTDAGPAPRSSVGLETGPLVDPVALEAEAQVEALGGRRTVAEAMAREMLAGGMITADEFQKLLEQHAVWEVEQVASAHLDVHFFVLQTFGESWLAKKKRLQTAAQDGNIPGWDLGSIIVKSNDDLRQEVFAMQLITFMGQILVEAKVPSYVRSYRIVSTGSTSGLVETITDAMSLDALKKKNEGMPLAEYFTKTYGASETAMTTARRAFAESLAAYSLACYAFQIKDRHNGNIMLDTRGHLIHIDFGFLFGIAPGGSFSLETAPFKLTAEMVDVLGGLRSPGFEEFVVLFVSGFLALQAQTEALMAMVETAAEGSTFPCFRGVDLVDSLRRLRLRLDPHFLMRIPPEEREVRTVETALMLIRRSFNASGTRQYDSFQWMTNGIHA